MQLKPIDTVKISRAARKNYGFTLLEILVAIAVITVGGMAVLTFVNNTLLRTNLNKQLITMTSLAREGTEIIRTLRDSNFTGFASLVDGNYIVDSNTNFNLNTVANDSDINNCSNCQLYLKDGRYAHDATGTLTPYKRLINISDANDVVCATPSCQKQIKSITSWQDKSMTHTFELVVHLTDWR